MDGSEVWRALSRPHRLLLTAWPWRALGYLLSGVVLGFALLILLVSAVGLGVLTLPVGVGAVLLVGVAFSGIPIGQVERRRLRLMGLPEPADPHLPVNEPGLRSWLAVRRREPATWRELGYALLMAGPLAIADLLLPGALLSSVAALLSAPLVVLVLDDQVDLYGNVVDTPAEAWPAAAGGLAALLVVLPLIVVYAAARAALARLLLGASEHEAQQALAAAQDSRARLARAFDAERRRIERDLHDGVQQQLVALAATIGLARHEAGGSARLDTAAEQVSDALAALRETVHELDPPVLRDRGLPDAIERVGRRSVLAVRVDAAVPDRLDPALERSVYFALCELLGNAEKHAQATTVDVRIGVIGSALVAEVRDDGVGGAAATGAGSGIVGIADRLAVHDGVFAVDSPDGGPTVARIEVPL
ncbi:sensor histidine kinase [Nocardioides speluncae]|uniref:sensor histidine kinase n=1 Tax=Nocardioides speluncae TaxID=2670337 RepID=UPI000D697D8D|nr:sensor histidine kinase [Nocardioides speluncae]